MKVVKIIVLNTKTDITHMKVEELCELDKYDIFKITIRRQLWCLIQRFLKGMTKLFR